MTDPAVASAVAGARTLTEALRRLDADALTRLLTLRPDLAYPVPGDVADLSAQATTTSSVGRALDGLNAWQRQVAEALAALPDPGGPARPDRAAARRSRPPPAAVADLRDRALLWGDDQRAAPGPRRPRPPGPVPRRSRSALAPPARRPEIDSRLAETGPEARAVVDRLLWNPAGTVNGADRAVTVEGARTPVEQLLARRLLRPAGPDTVLLPREVAWHLRDERFSVEPVPSTAPSVSGRIRTPALVDRAAIGAAYGFVHDVELVAHALQTTRTGCCARAEWPSATSPDSAGSSAPTTPTPPSCSSARPRRACWRSGTAAGCCRPSTTTAGPNANPPIAGARWPRPGGTPTGSPGCPASRARTRSDPSPRLPARPASAGLLTELLAAVPVGTTLDLADLHAVVGWHRPRLVRVGGVPLESVLAWTWREAGWLGVNSLGAVSGLARPRSPPTPARCRPSWPTRSRPRSSRSCCRPT